MIHETLRSYALTLDYLDTLLVGVSNDQMTMQAAGVVNHPAWTIGHLIYSAQLLAGELGKSPWLPADWEWERKFGTGSTPQATGYPPKKDLLALMTDAQYRLSERLHQMNPEDLEVPLPDERHRNT